MTLSLANAPVYDIESFPNCFLLSAEPMDSEQCSTWEISHHRDDRRELFAWIEWLRGTGTPMIGFNNLGYDYRMLHYLLQNPNVTVEQLYEFNNSIFASQDRFGGTIWERDRLVPQVDLFTVHHFDNRAKTTGLKALQINMRSSNVLESRVPFGTYLTLEQIVQDVIPYNVHDVKETKRFARYSMSALDFRTGLVGQFGMDVLNFNDTKIGEKMLEKRLGDDVCYTRDANGRKQKRQTFRRQIALRDIIFPYIRFDNPEFQRILDFKMAQTLAPEDLEDPDADIKTKGAYKISATVGGLEFHFGTGGVHASVERKVFVADDNWLIRDIDVEGLYPNVAIANGLAPAHLGERFTTEYAKIPAERKTHAKGTYMNGALKLAANGAWGKSNSKYSCFFDPQYAMSIPINGQLMVCMLAEKLAEVPSVTLIAANTDGITYHIKRSDLEQAKQIEKDWQALTRLKLEDFHYSRLWVRDINNYVAEYED